MGARPSSEAGGGGTRGRHRNDFSPITFIVHNQKSNGGGGHGVNGYAPPPLHSYVTVITIFYYHHNCYIIIIIIVHSINLLCLSFLMHVCVCEI